MAERECIPRSALLLGCAQQVEWNRLAKKGEIEGVRRPPKRGLNRGGGTRGVCLRDLRGPAPCLRSQNHAFQKFLWSFCEAHGARLVPTPRAHEVPSLAGGIVAGKTRGRVVIAL